MIVMALVPPVFRNIMDPLLEAHRLQFNPDRESAPDELARAQDIKRRCEAKTWLFTVVTFGGALAFVTRV